MGTALKDTGTLANYDYSILPDLWGAVNTDGDGRMNHKSTGLMPWSNLSDFINLYQRMGFKLKVNEGPNGYFILLGDADKLEGHVNSEGFDSFQDYYSRIDFNFDGEFISQGFYE